PALPLQGRVSKGRLDEPAISVVSLSIPSNDASRRSRPSASSKIPFPPVSQAHLSIRQRPPRAALRPMHFSSRATGFTERSEISSQLASVKQAPPAVIRRLAGNDEISVAGPVLTESARLSEADLVELAQSKSEAHLLAMSGRWWLAEVVTDALLARHYPSVSRKVVGNPGARVSASGYAIVLAQAENDPELAVETGIRVDLPKELRRQLLHSASEAVRSRLLSRAPPHLFEEIRGAIATAVAGADREMSRTHDFAAARRYVAPL